MRRRILCLVLFGLLAAPHVGWADGVDQDPNGQPGATQGTASVQQAGPESGSDASRASVPILWEILLDWFGRLGLSI